MRKRRSLLLVDGEERFWSVSLKVYNAELTTLFFPETLLQLEILQPDTEMNSEFHIPVELQKKKLFWIPTLDIHFHGPLLQHTAFIILFERKKLSSEYEQQYEQYQIEPPSNISNIRYSLGEKTSTAETPASLVYRHNISFIVWCQSLHLDCVCSNATTITVVS